MAKEQFKAWKPQAETRAMLDTISSIVESYTQQGYVLTLRQLYYQLVRRNIIPNRLAEYKKLTNQLTRARLAGLIDWSAIEDRGRSPVVPSEWKDPESILRAAANQYRLDRWYGQDNYVEVWCEKDALSSVIEPVCNRMHVRYMANKGYSSITAIYDASKRLRDAWFDEKDIRLIYLGDHDPSGLDMTRDVRERLELMGVTLDVQHLALTWDQVEEYNPPPNYAKVTDSRAMGYIAEYGDESWELDALDPPVLDELISTAIDDLLDTEQFERMVEMEQDHKDAIRRAAEEMPDFDPDEDLE